VFSALRKVLFGIIGVPLLLSLGCQGVSTPTDLPHHQVIPGNPPTGDSTGDSNGTSGGGSGDNPVLSCETGTPSIPKSVIQFVPVGVPLDFGLIDLEFLPGQGGEAIAITLDGKIFYLKKDFFPLPVHETIEVGTGEDQGLFNVVADPSYVLNHFIYLSYTRPDGLSNQVDRFTVNVDLNAESFSLADRQTIIEFPKSESSIPEDNHNGGALAFDNDGNLFIAMGDAGLNAGSDPVEQISQNPEVGLGKIHRIVPSRETGAGGYTVPEGNISSIKWPSIYALGFRNPFTMTYADGELFVGDVGSKPPLAFEEIDPVTTGGQNFGWPLVEGYVMDATHPEFLTPLHGYLNTDHTFDLQDPFARSGGRVIIVGHLYDGAQYGGVLSNRLLYNEFYAGWVRGLKLDSSHQIENDEYLGHLPGITSIQEGPDGFLYVVSLTDSDQVQRIELVPLESEGSGSEECSFLRFIPVGKTLGNDLIDFEFLPGQNGEAIVALKNGTLYYLRKDFTPFPQAAHLSVEGSGDQGLLNIVADPNYVMNHFIYIYYTRPGGEVNEVDRFTVFANSLLGTFELFDPQVIITFPKNDSPSPGDDDNGGGLVFQDNENLFIGVGDGGGEAGADQELAISLNPNLGLGKIHRIVPSRRPGVGGFSIPEEGNNALGTLASVYSIGFKDPSALVMANGKLLISDSGSVQFEEIDKATSAGQSFGWPLVDGHTYDPDHPEFVPPIYGYAHSDITFDNQDPLASPGENKIRISAFYTGSLYKDLLNNRLIYTDLNSGWIRGLKLNSNTSAVSDAPLGHLGTMTSMQIGPDGFLYAVSLGGSDHLLRVDVGPSP
jgi:glucose/arabinose dehydrogenase